MCLCGGPNRHLTSSFQYTHFLMLFGRPGLPHRDGAKVRQNSERVPGAGASGNRLCGPRVQSRNHREGATPKPTKDRRPSSKAYKPPSLIHQPPPFLQIVGEEVLDADATLMRAFGISVRPPTSMMEIEARVLDSPVVNPLPTRPRPSPCRLGCGIGEKGRREWFLILFSSSPGGVRTRQQGPRHHPQRGCLELQGPGAWALRCVGPTSQVVRLTSPPHDVCFQKVANGVSIKRWAVHSLSTLSQEAVENFASQMAQMARRTGIVRAHLP